MYDTKPGRALRGSLRELALGIGPQSESSRSELRDRVCAAVDELMGLGLPIEKVIIQLKEVAGSVGLPLKDDEFGRDREAVIRDLVRLCIDRYYNAND